MWGWTTLKIVWSSVWTLIKPVVMMLVNDVKDEAIETVIEIVDAVGATDLSSKNKRERAFELAKQKLQEGGKDIKDSTVNLLVELAVTKLKEENK